MDASIFIRFTLPKPTPGKKCLHILQGNSSTYHFLILFLNAERKDTGFVSDGINSKILRQI